METVTGTDVDRTVPALGVIERQTAVMMRHSEMLHRRTAVDDGLDRAEYLMLRTLDDCGPLDINGLAAALGLDPSTAGRQVTVLQREGLVLRSPAPADRRRCIVTPTPEGMRRMETVRTRRSGRLADLLADWSEEDLHTLGTMFDRYNRSVAAKFLAGPDAGPVADTGTVAGPDAVPVVGPVADTGPVPDGRAAVDTGASSLAGGNPPAGSRG